MPADAVMSDDTDNPGSSKTSSDWEEENAQLDNDDSEFLALYSICHEEIYSLV